MPGTFDLDALLTSARTRVIACTGAGGVGKTTIAAAVGVRAADLGRNVCVLTIDPARRLAQALGVDGLSNDPTPVDTGGSGSLHAMMLDMEQTFDGLVMSNTTHEKARRIMENPFYKTMVTSFAGTQEYMAMERLGQLLEESKWDLLVVDTPPSRNALDFLDAPSRLGSFLDSRLMRLLTAPGRGVGRLVTGAMSTALRGVSTVIGSSLLSDASDFVIALDTTFNGFTARAARTQEILRRPGTEFLVVSSAEKPALREAAFFVDRLGDEDMPLAGVVINRTHPRLADFSAEEAHAAAERVAGRHPEAASVLRIHADRALTAGREVRLLKSFTSTHPGIPIVGVPSLPFDVSDLRALRAVGDQLASGTDEEPVEG